jgi:hypothetical protein
MWWRTGEPKERRREKMVERTLGPYPLGTCKLAKEPHVHDSITYHPTRKCENWVARPENQLTIVKPKKRTVAIVELVEGLKTKVHFSVVCETPKIAADAVDLLLEPQETEFTRQHLRSLMTWVSKDLDLDGLLTPLWEELIAAGKLDLSREDIPQMINGGMEDLANAMIDALVEATLEATGKVGRKLIAGWYEGKLALLTKPEEKKA